MPLLRSAAVSKNRQTRRIDRNCIFSQDFILNQLRTNERDQHQAANSNGKRSRIVTCCAMCVAYPNLLGWWVSRTRYRGTERRTWCSPSHQRCSCSWWHLAPRGTLHDNILVSNAVPLRTNWLCRPSWASRRTFNNLSFWSMLHWCWM